MTDLSRLADDLRKGGYDGLYCTEEPCGCELDDLAPCGMDPQGEEGLWYCKPAYRRECIGDDCAHPCDGRMDPGGDCFGPSKEGPKRKEPTPPTPLERLAELGRPVEKTKECLARISWNRSHGLPSPFTDVVDAAFAERMASEVELAGMLQIVCDDLAHSTAYPASAGDCGFLYDAGNRAQYLEDVKRRAKEATDAPD